MDMNLSATLEGVLAQAAEAQQNQQKKEKEDIQAMNRFLVKAGLLTDDEFFGGL